jgi:type IV secretion system protein VirB6
MSSEGGLFAFLGTSIDQALNTFVTTTSTAIAAGIAPIVVSGLTIWVMVYGYAVMRQEVSDPVNVFAWRAVKISIILAFALSSGIYQSEVVAAANGVTDGLTSIVAKNKAGNIYGVLDALDKKGADIATTIASHGLESMPWGGYLDLVAAAVTLTANAILLIFCGGFVLLAKVAMAIILGLGPLFIATLAFEPIKKFFDSWLSALLNYILLLVLLAMFVSLSISLCTSYIDQFAKDMDNANAMASAFGLMTLEGALLIVLWQVPTIAASLSGGSALGGLGVGRMAGHGLVDMITRASKGDKKDTPPKGGGTIKNDGGGGGGGGGAGGGGAAERPGSGSNGKGSRVPAYRKATMDQMDKRRR